MVALITGASSGIGRDMARYLSTKGYDLIINGRNEDRLKELKDEIESSNSERKVSIIVADLNKIKMGENQLSTVKYQVPMWSSPIFLF